MKLGVHVAPNLLDDAQVARHALGVFLGALEQVLGQFAHVGCLLVQQVEIRSQRSGEVLAHDRLGHLGALPLDTSQELGDGLSTHLDLVLAQEPRGDLVVRPPLARLGQDVGLTFGRNFHVGNLWQPLATERRRSPGARAWGGRGAAPRAPTGARRRWDQMGPDGLRFLRLGPFLPHETQPPARAS